MRPRAEQNIYTRSCETYRRPDGYRVAAVFGGFRRR